MRRLALSFRTSAPVCSRQVTQSTCTTALVGDTMVATLTIGLNSEREVTVDPREVQGLLKGVNALETDRVAQKKALQECNEKLAAYIERVRLNRFLLFSITSILLIVLLVN